MDIAGADAFPEQTRLQTRFLDQLTSWHTKHDTTLFARGKKQRLREGKRSGRNCLGPQADPFTSYPPANPKAGTLTPICVWHSSRR